MEESTTIRKVRKSLGKERGALERRNSWIATNHRLIFELLKLKGIGAINCYISGRILTESIRHGTEVCRREVGECRKKYIGWCCFIRKPSWHTTYSTFVADLGNEGARERDWKNGMMLTPSKKSVKRCLHTVIFGAGGQELYNIARNHHAVEDGKTDKVESGEEKGE